MKLKPIHPFEPMSALEIPKGEEWIAQIKWDGVRVLTYFDGQDVKLFNRKLNERTAIFPELTNIHSYLSANSAILDGEVIALDEKGQPSFHEVMRRDGIRRLDRVTEIKKTVPIYYMVFDIVFLNGKWIQQRPLHERLDLLSSIIKQHHQVQMVPIEEDGHTLFSICKQHNLEGIVCKNLDSQYVVNGKNDHWLKIKNYKDIITVVAGVTYRSGIVNSMLLGLYDDKEHLWYIGHVGTGKLTNEEWKQFTHMISPLTIDQKPFVNQPERVQNVQWLTPTITVKIQYIDWPEGHSLRQPSIQAFVFVDPKACKLSGADINETEK